MDRPPCAGLWHTPMVHVEGDVTTCCLDEHLHNRIGNVRDTPLATLWNGPVMQAWRRAHAEGRFEDSGPYCTKCNWRSAGALPRAELEAWAAATGEAGVLARLRNARAKERTP